MCVGVVLLKKWEQGYTWLSKTIGRPLAIEVFFYEVIFKKDVWNSKRFDLCDAVMIDFDPKTPQKPQDLGKFWKIVCKLFKIDVSENIFSLQHNLH